MAGTIYISNDVGLHVSLCPSPLIYVPDHAAMSARLLASDEILCRWDQASLYTNYSKQANRSLMFNVTSDSDIPALLAIASTYNVTSLSYNLEWPDHGPPDILARLITTRAALDGEGNTLPLVFGPIYGNFVNYYDDYIPYVEGFGVQMQTRNVGTEPALAADAISDVMAVWPEEKADPLMVFQISCHEADPYGRTYEEALAAVRGVAAVAGVTGIGLYFANYDAGWELCDLLLSVLRPG